MLVRVNTTRWGPLWWLSNLLLMAGLSAVLFATWALLDGKLYQTIQKRQVWEKEVWEKEVWEKEVWEKEGATIPAVAPTFVPPAAPGTRLLLSLLPKELPKVLPQPDPTAIGELEIPRLGLDVVMREGVDDPSLRKAVGHLPSSALPGEAGNFVLLGHRDTFFRPLRSIERGDTIRVRARTGNFVYKVESIQVTEPDWTGAVERTREPVITLITCFPFDYFGSAPRRFVVRARLEP